MDGSSNHCTLIARPNPFESDNVYAQVQAGQTIAQMLGAGASDACEVSIGGLPVPHVLWAQVKPKAGQMVHVAVYPQGGNSGKWLKLILMVVLVIVTYGWAAPYLAGVYGGTVAAWGSAIMLVGTLAINALIPPPTPKGLNGGAASGDPFKQLESITGTSNQASPYGVIPCVVGTMRYFPPHAALPFTEISGDDQYLRMLLDFGYGDLDISDIQIGGTDIASFDDVEYQISTAPTLFAQDVYELAVGTALPDSTNDTRTTQVATTEISLDLVFSQGLFGVDAKGKTVAGATSFVIQYRPTGSGTWTTAATASGLTTTNGLASDGTNFTLSSSARKTLRVGARWKVPSGQYDVQVTRGITSWTGAVANGQVGEDCAWSVLRSFSPQLPSTTGTTKLAVRIKATGQLNGVVQNLSVMAAQKIPTWSKTTQTWTAETETANPAWIYAWLMTRCPAVIRRLADSRLDMDTIADWAAECDTKGLKCSFVMDSGRALGDILKDVLAAGRASFGMTNGKYSAVRDIAQTVPVQMFTPANSWGFAYTRAFADLPHALRISFTNPEANYQQDVIVAYADGYSADGAGGTTAATRFETLALAMVTDPIAAWKLGVYHLAVGYARPNTYVLNADIENLVCERGDLVYCAHDITQWGSAWGRIKAVGADGKTITLDGPQDLASGATYKLRVRRSDGTQTTATVTTAAGTGYTQLVVSTALLSTDVDNLFVLGEVTQDVAQLLVKAIDPGDDLSAQLTLVDAAQSVLDVDAGTPPTFVSSITGQAWCAAPDPPDLSIIYSAGPNSPRNDGGTTRALVGVGIAPQGGIYRMGLAGMASHGAERA